jgi:hypothetical protein
MALIGGRDRSFAGRECIIGPRIGRVIPIRDESFGGPAVELGVGLDEVGLVG